MGEKFRKIPAPLLQANPAKPQNPDGGAELEHLTLVKAQPPSQYQVLMMNDDYTPMDFVVYVLMRFFQKSAAQATALMLQVHQQGRAVCGIYSFEIAETKVTQVMQLARDEKHPLRCTMEKKP